MPTTLHDISRVGKVSSARLDTQIVTLPVTGENIEPPKMVNVVRIDVLLDDGTVLPSIAVPIENKSDCFPGAIYRDGLLNPAV